MYLNLGLSTGVGGKVKTPKSNSVQISPADKDVRERIVYSGHSEMNYASEIKQQPTDPSSTDRSGALQAGSRIGKQTYFL